MMVRDFTNYLKSRTYRAYSGANGKKLGVKINDECYFIKPTHYKLLPKLDLVIRSYSPFSEYICSNIFNILGINSHETALGYFTHNNTQIPCVLCKDFRAISHSLLEFKFIKNSVLEKDMTINNKDDLDIILRVIEAQHFVPKDELKRRFWDMFVVDAYIGNFDRHSGNWGILVNEIDQICTLAPVYDNGSALFAGLPEDDIQSVLLNENEMKRRVYDYPVSAISQNSKKISYYEFINSTKNSDCLKSIEKIIPKIVQNKDKIYALIDTIDENLPNGEIFLSRARKEFYKTILNLRFEKIFAKFLG